MHAQHALERQQVVEHGEDRLLQLARVAGAADQAELPLEAEDDERARARPVRGLVRLERRRAHDRELGHVLAVRLAARRRLEHVAHEEAVPRLLGDDAQRQPVLRLRARVEILDEEVAALEEAEQAAEDLLELVGRERAVVLAPPDMLGGRRLADDELVLRGARGVLARVHDDGAAVDDPALAAEGDLLVERLGRQVPVDAARVRDAVVLEPVVARELARLRLRGRLHVERVEAHSQSLTRRRSPM